MPRTFRALLLVTAILAIPASASAQKPKPRREFTGAKAVIRNIAFSPDGKSIAAGTMADEVRIWDVATGKAMHLLQSGAGSSMPIAFAPDSKSIVTTSWNNGSLLLWDLPKGTKRLTLSRDSNGAHHVAYSPDGKWIASTGAEIRIWNASTGKNVHSIRNRQGGCTVVFSPDSKRLLASDHSGDAAIWDVATGKKLHALQPGSPSAGLAFSPDGSRCYIGSGNGYIHEFDSTGKKLRAWTTAGHGNARTLSISPDGRSLAVSTETGTVQVWELATLQQRRAIPAVVGFAWAVAFAPDGKSIAAAGDDRVVRLFDVTGGWAEPDAEKKKPRTEAQLEAYWKDLSGDADVAYTAVWAMAAHGKQSVALLAKKLKTLKGAPMAKQIARLIEQLDDDDFEVRESASKALEQGGATARLALQGAIKGQLTLEQKRRITMLLVKLRDAKLSRDEAVRLRVVEVLAKIDSAEARKLLEALAKNTAEKK